MGSSSNHLDGSGYKNLWHMLRYFHPDKIFCSTPASVGHDFIRTVFDATIKFFSWNNDRLRSNCCFTVVITALVATWQMLRWNFFWQRYLIRSNRSLAEFLLKLVTWGVVRGRASLNISAWFELEPSSNLSLKQVLTKPTELLSFYLFYQALP